ncbi:hypothetical protein [Streptomyces antarcticus]|uniref:hypothetical protein n=1 Tax=Streptomyces antarcticus TaxID=2996458 RepID=UPI00226E4235|nr:MULTISPECIES: hypothetical protein [unclassified Streptomyces]MCY0944280.1 hypothetical protein [Streptomyces sp. H34-AA3]MCY0954726.1 hypothetical protein [Streptomyces sp. H27-S2]MCZ4087142.1 hypothetical protein [Streptomyces sp. H34-S5]
MTTDFADEARSRVAQLLRMAASADDRTRARIVAYAASTPDPPPYGPDGIRTTGCPRCHRTMWMQRTVWVCSSCGHVEDDRVNCHRCDSPMYESDANPGKWWCRCGAYRATGESTADVRAREDETARVMALLDEAIAERPGAQEQRDSDLLILATMETDMGQTIQTAGCDKCGGTMYRTVDTDDKGNPIGMGPYVCAGCGHMRG